MQKIECFDIETIPDEAKYYLVQTPDELMEEAKPPANLKNQDAIDNWRDKKYKEYEANYEERKQKLALSPFTGRVASWATIDQDGKTDFQVIGRTADVQEKIIVKRLVDKLCDADIVVSFNGMQFDFPFLYGRAAMLDIGTPPFPLSYWMKRYTYTPHFDVRLALTNWDSRAPGSSLSHFSRAMFDNDKEDMDVTKILPCIKARKTAELKLYNIKDVELTMNIFAKIASYYCSVDQFLRRY